MKGMTRRNFEETYQEHYSRVYRFALGLTANPAWAEEVTQEAFLRLLRFDTSRTPLRNPASWLLRVAHNLSIDLFKKQRQTPSRQEILTSRTPEDEFQHQRMKADVLKAIARLSQRQRECITLRRLGGQSYREIAQTLQISVNDVRVHLHRARQNLKHHLEEWI